ncbi:MAG: flagellar biosynthetic protein FliR, partial [Deltaproteobacteria bacterium]|nr:flagellar biosynthetic protein FliR [Deltaproteobacteria bacterium]
MKFVAMEEIMSRLGINVNFSFVLIFASLIWVRILAIVSVIPFLFGKPVPKTVRIGGSMVLAAFAYRYLITASPPPVTEDMIVLSMLYLKEAFIGLVIGFGAALIFYGFEAAGQMIDSQRGMSIARVLIPELGTQSSLAGTFLFQLSVVTYLTVGGHQLFFNAVYGSYQVLPLFEFPNIAGAGLMPLMDFFIKLSAQVLVLSVQIAAPVIIAILIADIILGVANRIAPQINVWELGFNVKGYLGVL